MIARPGTSKWTLRKPARRLARVAPCPVGEYTPNIPCFPSNQRCTRVSQCSPYTTDCLGSVLWGQDLLHLPLNKTMWLCNNLQMFRVDIQSACSANLGFWSCSNINVKSSEVFQWPRRDLVPPHDKSSGGLNWLLCTLGR